MKKIFLLFSLLIWTAAAGAQDLQKAELFGGFSYSRGFPIDLNMYGWNASLAGVVNRWFSIVGDLSDNYGRFGESYHVSILSVAGGPQFSYRTKTITPFVRFLIGANRIGVSHANATNFGVVLGGGFDISVNKRFAIRPLQADWMHANVEGGHLNQGRLSAGVVVKF
jgi:hypothetical protein